MRRHFLLSALAGALAATVTLSAARPFPQAESDLRPDSAATFGALPNGVRYVVMPNKEPKGRASLRLLVLAGSFDETEAQRGLAHFLEHMAFNGSTHYAPGTLVEKLQRLGMGFGADTNAATSFDHTIYQLELPDTGTKTLGEGLQILADYGGGLLLQQNMVDKERGIILSEKRTRDSVGYRTFVAQAEFMYAGTRVPDRLPIGLSDVIEKSTRDPFVDFYNAWYRPENLVVIVVGDIDAAAVEKQIVGLFTPLAARAPAPVPTDRGQVARFLGVKTRYHFEPEAPDTQVTIAAVTPFTHEPDTAASRVKYLPRFLAVDMINERLDILSKKEKAPFTRASTGVDESFDLYREASIEITSKAEQWIPALNVADQELRRALAYGFGPAEFKEAVANFRNNVEQAAKSASTRRSDALAGDLADSLVDRDVFTSPADDLALYGAALDRVTPADCLEALKAAWPAANRYVFVSGNLKFPGVPVSESNTVVSIAYNKAEAVPVKASAEAQGYVWGYTDFGPAGAIASRTHVDDLDITQVVFANGVRLNLKKTDFEASQIHVEARLGTGELTEPAAAEPGLSTFANVTFSAGGLGKHSVDDLQRMFAGKNVGAAFQSGPDAFTLAGETTKDDESLEFQLLAAAIKDPGYRPEAMRIAQKKIEAAYISFEHTDSGPRLLHVASLLASGDPRFGLPPESQMMARTQDEVKAWLAPQLASGPLEVSVVGDFDVEATIAIAAKTLGTLPHRDTRPALDDRRKVSFPAQPFEKEFGLDTKIPKGVVAIYWPTTDGMDIHRTRRLNLLAQILSDRLRVKVREQLGGTYSPNVVSTASDVFPGYGYINAVLVVDPARTKQMEDVVIAAAADMRTSGITQDEIDRTKNPAMTAIHESERTNAYWMNVLLKSQEKPEVLDWSRSRVADVNAVTKAELDALAKLYLAPENATKVVIKPYAAAPNSLLLRPGVRVPTPTPPPDS